MGWRWRGRSDSGSVRSWARPGGVKELGGGGMLSMQVNDGLDTDRAVELPVGELLRAAGWAQ